MPLALFLLAMSVGAWGVAWVHILPAEGHLLASPQRRWRLWYQARYNRALDERWWFNPLWGCATCHAGQVMAWAYLLRYFHHYDFFLHLLAVGLALVTATLLRLWTPPQ